MSDQHRADALGCTGNAIVETPNLDRMGRGGVIFDQAYVQCPVCMASRAAIHTGRYPSALRVPSMGVLPPSEVTLAEALKRAGYRTGMFGKLHLTPEGYTLHDRGVDRPVFDAGFFLEDAGILSESNRAAVADPYKKNYGFDVCVGVEDMLWGNYLDWLAEVSPEHRRCAVAENWGRETDGVKYAQTPPAAPMFRSHVTDFFDSRIPAEFHPSRFIVEKTLEFICKNQDRPFFAHCSFVDPHHPFNAPQPFGRMYPPEQMPIPPKVEGCYPENLPPGVRKKIERHAGFPDDLWQWALANYYGMISHIDSCLGRLFDGLRSMDLLENTIIVFTADHGEYAGDHRLLYKGSLLFDGIVRVPLFVTWRGKLAGGRRCASMVQEIDIFPTILSLLDVPIHPGVQGKDLSGMLRGGEEIGYERVFCELDELPDKTYMPSQMIRSHTWKLNYFAEARTGMLYNLAEDPGETRNRYFDPDCAGIRHELMMDLLDHHYRAKDPLPIRLSQA